MNLKEKTFAPKFFDCLKGYNSGIFTADLMAGIVVGIVAIPLAIAFGIASGVGPAEGLITAIIAGFLSQCWVDLRFRSVALQVRLS